MNGTNKPPACPPRPQTNRTRRSEHLMCYQNKLIPDTTCPDSPRLVGPNPYARTVIATRIGKPRRKRQEAGSAFATRALTGRLGKAVLAGRWSEMRSSGIGIAITHGLDPPATVRSGAAARALHPLDCFAIRASRDGRSSDALRLAMTKLVRPFLKNALRSAADAVASPVYTSDATELPSAGSVARLRDPKRRIALIPLTEGLSDSFGASRGRIPLRGQN